MENYNDDFLFIEDDELFLGDSSLNIDNNNSDSKDKEKRKTQEFEDSENLLEVDDDEEEEIIDEEDDDDKYQLQSDEKDKTKKKITKPIKNIEEDELDENTDTNSDNPYSAWGQSLAEKGFFPDIEEEVLNSVNNEDDISDLLEKQLNTTFNQWKNSYTSNLVNNLIADGYIKQSDVPNLISQSYTEEDIKNDSEVAKNVIRKYYKRTNVPDKEIERIISSRDDLEESALELNKLNAEYDKREQQTAAEKIKQREAEQQRKIEDFNRNVQSTAYSFNEFIPGRKLNKRDKDDAIRNVQPTLGKVNSNLAKYGVILSYLDKYGILDGDFTKIIKDKNSQEVKNDFQRLMEKKRVAGGGAKQRKSGDIYIDDSGIKSIYK